MNRRLRFWLSPLTAFITFIALGQFFSPEPNEPAWIGWTYIWIGFGLVGLGASSLGWVLSRRMVRHAKGSPLRLGQMLQTMSQSMAVSFVFSLCAGVMSVGYRLEWFSPLDHFLNISYAGWSVIFIIMGLGGVIATAWYMITEMRYIREHPDDKE